MDNKIFSVGIDIGTTTTQLIFSEITLKNIAGPFLMPKVEITDKKIIYRSKVHFTPLVDGEGIDYEKLKLLVEEEFRNSGISKTDISTGAVIITGETSRKDNAKQVTQSLSDYVGDFVVATAGPDLEAVLAGYGSGAAELSKKYGKRIINFDIGGGTTNACYFNCGKVEDFYALDIGGRLIKLSNNGEISYISERIKHVIRRLGLDSKIKLNCRPEFQDIKLITDRLAYMFLELSRLKPMREDTRKLFIAHENIHPQMDFVTFSGGVSEYVYSEDEKMNFDKATKYGDMGPLLGASIREVFKEYADKLLVSNEKIRATVIGAGNFSMKVSGSTVIFDEEILPIKNIPIIKCDENLSDDLQLMFSKAKKKVELYEDRKVALSFKGPVSPSYQLIKEMSEGIISVYDNSRCPIIIIVENDFAKALGQTIKNRISGKKPVICLDKIETKHGDYIDIGKPVAGVIPVVVKTLIFET